MALRNEPTPRSRSRAAHCGAVIAAIAVGCAALSAAHADSGPGPEEALNKKIAVWRFDALGINDEIVQRLETLFRLELDRLDRQPLPTRKDIDAKVTAAEQNCTGEPKCLTAIGKRLRVDYVITGTVGSLGDHYILNIRAVDVATGLSSTITSDPLQGTPDQLIEGVRVAAYRLLAPDQLHGALQLESDLAGANVWLDGKPLGTTPLVDGGVVRKLALGKHALRVEAPGYAAWDQDVAIQFQKVSPVVVRLIGTSTPIALGAPIRSQRNPIYSRPWFLIAVGVATVAIGAYVGYRVGHVNCHVYPSGDSC